MRKTPVLLWLVLLGALLAAFVMMNPARMTGSQDIAIGDFISRVESGQIVIVTISGDRVQGTTAAGERFTAYSTDNTELIRVAREKRVAYREEPPSRNAEMLMWILKLALPIILLVVLMRGMSKAAGGGPGGILQKTLSSKATLHKQVKTRFTDVAGADEAKEECKDLVEFLKDPKRFVALGGRPPKGILLVGEAGCGKTLLARAVAGEAGVPFLELSGSSFVEMFVGVGASRVRDLFETGRKHAPCIIFIDELDAIGKKRGGITMGGGHDERETTLNELLVAMDGFSQNDGVIVMGATNRPETLDSALLRPGRFDRHVVVPKPDLRGREAILKVHARKLTLAPDVDLRVTARATTGMTGADLENLLNEAALRAGKLGKKAVDMSDVEYAREKIQMGPERRSAMLIGEEKVLVARHEAGHTVAGWLSPDADPVHRVTVIPRGMALGLTWSLPIEERRLMSRDQLLAIIDTLYGGRIAEELFYGRNVSTGAQNDLERVTALGIKLLADWGMGEDDLALRTFGEKQRGFIFEESRKDYSEETAARLDRALNELLKARYARVKELLSQNRDKLERLAQALIVKETLEAPEIEAILGPRPTASAGATDPSA